MPESIKNHWKTIIVALITSLVPVIIQGLYIVPLVKKHLADPHPHDVRQTQVRLETVLVNNQALILDVRHDIRLLEKDLKEIQKELRNSFYDNRNKGGK